jgi:hypothetical protein
MRGNPCPVDNRGGPYSNPCPICGTMTGDVPRHIEDEHDAE